MGTEFSVILLADDNTARLVEQLRQMLPASPLRNDKPHITLQNRIMHSAVLSDNELIRDVSDALPKIKFPLKVAYSSANDHFSEKYGDSSVIRVSVGRDILKLKSQLVKYLTSSDYELNQEFSTVYEPHITVGLGVPFTKTMREKTDEVLGKEAITLNHLAIHRFYDEDGKRLVKTLSV